MARAHSTCSRSTGWLGHRINDGATLSPGASDEAVTAYYRQSSERRNCCAVALCVPLLGFVTTEAVAAGDELLATMGHSYWLQVETELGEASVKLSQDTAREADLWQVLMSDHIHGHVCMCMSPLLDSMLMHATWQVSLAGQHAHATWQVSFDKRHPMQLNALDDFISRLSADIEAEVEAEHPRGTSGGGRAKGAANGGGKEASEEQAAPRTGFGNAAVGPSAPPKRASKTRRKKSR